MTDSDIEQEIQDKGLDAPRITPGHIESLIKYENYHIFPVSCVTVCCLKLQNGFAVTGESACVHPENFDEDLGRKLARKRAVEKIWELEGYLLKERLYQEQEAFRSGAQSVLERRREDQRRGNAAFRTMMENAELAPGPGKLTYKPPPEPDLYFGDAVEPKKSPFADRRGKRLFLGDTIEDREGMVGVIRFCPSIHGHRESWVVDYGAGSGSHRLHRVCANGSVTKIAGYRVPASVHDSSH